MSDCVTIQCLFLAFTWRLLLPDLSEGCLYTGPVHGPQGAAHIQPEAVGVPQGRLSRKQPQPQCRGQGHIAGGSSY